MPTNSTPHTTVDLTNASDADLQSIKNEVMNRLATRATSPALVKADGYDRHGSGHSRSSPPSKTLQAATAE